MTDPIEAGIDPKLIALAEEQATALLIEYAQGVYGPEVPDNLKIIFRKAFLLGYITATKKLDWKKP